MMAFAQVVETSVNTNNSPSQDYTTNPDDHWNHNTIFMTKQWDTRGSNSGSFSSTDLKFGSFIAK